MASEKFMNYVQKYSSFPIPLSSKGEYVSSDKSIV